MRTILTLFIALPLTSLSQDRIITIDTDTLNVKVIKSAPNEVEYVYPNEDAVNVLSKNNIFKIEYASGRIEVVRPVGAYRYQDPVKPKSPKTRPKFRWGVRVGINQPLISGLDNGSVNKTGVMAGFSSDIKFVGTRNSVVVGLYANQMYAESPSGLDKIEIVYASIPIMWGADINRWLTFVMGLEPSFTVYSDYYQSGSYYDVSGVTKPVALGVTMGGRFFISPNKFYIDARGIGGVSDMFTFAENSPHKLNLSIGYYIKY